MKPHDMDDLDDPIEALRAELQRVPPPPGYVARLRQRIDAEADAPARTTWWRWASPIAAVAAVLLAVAINRPVTQAPVVSTVRVEPSSAASALQPSPVPPTVAATSAAVRVPPVVHRAANPPLPTAEPMPEIITNQAEVFRALWARTARRTTLVESTEVLPDPAAEIVVAPIEIAPLVIKPLTGGGTPSSAPIVRPPDRNSSEGRAK